ncbi:MAG: hypothetical protein NVSMB12_04690 [Acidimicrobiales bacterium]
MVLVILLVVTQVAFDLYARSAVTSAAIDAARSVADDRSSLTYPSGETAAIAQAEQRASAALGAYGRTTAFHWSLLPSADRPEIVALRVRFDLRGSRYSLVGPLTLPGLDRFDRTVRVRIERLVCPPGDVCAPVA